MAVNHRITSWIFALVIGLFLSYCSYQWTADTDRDEQRALEVSVVKQSRLFLESYVGFDNGIEISDPLNRVREAGKVYIYPVESGWELSGHYRRTGERRWHPFLMTLDPDASLVSLLVEDAYAPLVEKAATDEILSISRSN